MALNRYFRENQSGQEIEATLMQDLSTELIQQSGIDTWYIRRDTQNQDSILNEAPLSAFDESWKIEVFLETFEGFNGVDNDLIAGFGFQLQDRAQFSVSAERMLEVTGMVKPREGDLIWLPLSKTLLEIKFSDEEEAAFLLGSNHFYKFHTEIFDYSGEEFDTGIADVDLLDDSLQSNDELLDVADQTQNDAFDDQDDFVDFSESTPYGSFGS